MAVASRRFTGVQGVVVAPPPKTFARRPSASVYIPSLDGIRAGAVLWVFAAHAGLAEWGIPGNLGVTIFFFLSGYLITTLLRIECERTGSINLSAFYLRRVLRIFPPMYLALALASLLTAVGLLEGSLSPDAVLAQAFQLSNYYIIQDGWWDGRAPGTWVYWSLAVEEHFYLVFPLMYLVLRRLLPSGRDQFVALATLCGAVLAWRLLLVFGIEVGRDRTYIATDTRVDSILFGCMLAVYGNPVLDTVRGTARRWTQWGLPLGIIGLLLSIGYRDARFQETFRYTLQGLALFPFFIVAVRSPDWGVCRLLNLGWIRRIGGLSYSIYLIHTTILFGVNQWTGLPILLQGIVALTMSLLFAVAIEQAVERPCARLRRRLSRVQGRREEQRLPRVSLGQPVTFPMTPAGTALLAPPEVPTGTRTLESVPEAR